MKFSRDFLVTVLDSDLYVHLEQVASKRWTAVVEMVFLHEGKHFRTTYERGLTEMQECEPWEHQTEIECSEVRPVQKTVTAWEVVTHDTPAP